MSNILKDLSTPALVKAIKGNRFEWYGYLGRSPKAELHDSPNLTLLLTGVPFPLMNTVIRTHLTRDKVDEVIEETVTHFKSKNVTSFSWWTEPGTRPTDLGKHLVANGFTYTEGPPGMAVDLLTLNEDLTTPPGLTIKRVGDAAVLRKWVHTLMIGFGLPNTGENAFFDLLIGLGFDMPLPNYVGFLNEGACCRRRALPGGRGRGNLWGGHRPRGAAARDRRRTDTGPPARGPCYGLPNWNSALIRDGAGSLPSAWISGILPDEPLCMGV